MGKLPQISKASKSNVILLKQEGYKNVEISNDWNSLKHPLVEYYKETSKILVFLPWKEVADHVPPLPGRIAKSNNFAKSNHSFLHQK